MYSVHLLYEIRNGWNLLFPRIFLKNLCNDQFLRAARITANVNWNQLFELLLNYFLLFIN